MPMLTKYDRLLASDYAVKYALFRNPKFFNFDDLGGDCTNFCSQCLLAGSNNIMNKEYMSEKDYVVVSTDKGLEKRENVDNISEIW